MYKSIEPYPKNSNARGDKKAPINGKIPSKNSPKWAYAKSFEYKGISNNTDIS